jgi:2-polyprenyl-6-hydroxyphenyl methylase/3-demethylubiquinone-9 3-methyltransferase
MADGPTPRNDLTIYDDVAARWWSDEVPWLRVLRSMVPGRLRWFDPIVGDWTGRDALDLGCAGGFMAEALAQRGAQVTGIDPAADAVEAARVHAAQEGLAIRYDVGVGEALPYADESFDIVVCVDVLEHVADLRAVCDQVARVLRPGGLFLYDTINRNAVSRFAVITMAEDVLGLLPKGTHDPDRFIRPEELDAALCAAGLTPQARTGLGPRGVTLRGRPIFGPVPFTTPLYMGAARREAADGGPFEAAR